MMKKKGCNQDSFAVSAKLGSAAAFWASKSCIWCSACSLSHAVIPIMMSSMVPVVPKNTRGPRDFRFIPTGIAKRAPATENTQVPNALHKTACKSMSQTILLLTRKIYLNAVFKWQTATKYESSPCLLKQTICLIAAEHKIKTLHGWTMVHTPRQRRERHDQQADAPPFLKS